MTPNARTDEFDASVIVPVYMHWDLVPELLTRLSQQTVSANRFEIIIVNNGGDQPPPLSLPSNARIIQCLTPGSYAARNAGVAVSSGRWLLFTDADCRPEADWLAELLNAGLSQGGLLLAGRIRMVSSSAQPSIAEAYELIRGIPQERHVSRGYAATANLAVERKVFDAVGGFNPARLSGGDAEFCRRSGKAGYGLRYVPAAVVQHPARATWSEVVTRARRIKGGHLMGGTGGRRAAWIARSLLPPGKSILRILRSGEHPLPLRVSASLACLALWPINVAEVFRLVVLRRPPERR